jgi:hypothetical protein
MPEPRRAALGGVARGARSISPPARLDASTARGGEI